jgi:hypothetical protein
MRLPLLILHIFSGTIGLLSGSFAIAVRKGNRLHRASGNVFNRRHAELGLQRPLPRDPEIPARQRHRQHRHVLPGSPAAAGAQAAIASLRTTSHLLIKSRVVGKGRVIAFAVTHALAAQRRNEVSPMGLTVCGPTRRTIPCRLVSRTLAGL